MEEKDRSLLIDKGNKRMKIMVVDDHPIIHEGLEHLLSQEEDMVVCGYAESAKDAITEIDRLNPDLVLVDIILKGSVGGIDLVKEIRSRYPDLKTLVLSMHDENLYAERAIRAGAMGYLMKEELRGTIVKAIRQIMDGKIYLSENMISKFLDDFMFDQQEKIGPNIDKLSDRELEVFQLIGQGYKTNEIAKKLDVSVKTIGTYRMRMQEKLNLESSASLIKYAVEWARNK